MNLFELEAEIAYRRTPAPPLTPYCIAGLVFLLEAAARSLRWLFLQPAAEA